MKSKHKHSLSIVYATFNEEAMIEKSLKSIAHLADELIVVDGTSSDKTPEIAKKYGARVITTTNKPIFHINKQMAMDEAKGEWILQMDADEVVDAEMAKDIERIINEDPETLPAAYWLKRRNWFLGKFLTKGGQYPDPVIRFYKHGKAFLPMKSVHEQMEVDGEVGWLKGHLLHYSSPTFADYLMKSNRYTTLTAMEWEKHGEQLSSKNTFTYLFWKPFQTFFLIYLRHKGILDGFAGFAFSLFSALHYPLAYIKFWEMKNHARSH